MCAAVYYYQLLKKKIRGGRYLDNYEVEHVGQEGRQSRDKTWTQKLYEKQNKIFDAKLILQNN